jgi:hypothetical protein
MLATFGIDLQSMAALGVSAILLIPLSRIAALMITVVHYLSRGG